jgi:hypothetical protein
MSRAHLPVTPELNRWYRNEFLPVYRNLVKHSDAWPFMQAEYTAIMESDPDIEPQEAIEHVARLAAKRFGQQARQSSIIDYERRRRLGELTKEELRQGPDAFDPVDVVEEVSLDQIDHDVSDAISEMRGQRASHGGGRQMSDEQRQRVAEWEKTRAARRRMEGA